MRKLNWPIIHMVSYQLKQKRRKKKQSVVRPPCTANRTAETIRKSERRPGKPFPVACWLLPCCRIAVAAMWKAPDAPGDLFPVIDRIRSYPRPSHGWINKMSFGIGCHSWGWGSVLGGNVENGSQHLFVIYSKSACNGVTQSHHRINSPRIFVNRYQVCTLKANSASNLVELAFQLLAYGGSVMHACGLWRWWWEQTYSEWKQ